MSVTWSLMPFAPASVWRRPLGQCTDGRPP
jgi:hypothetical protein